jgi:hypothetical protein
VEWSETLLVVDHGIFPITVRDEYGINRGGVPCIIAGSKCDANTTVFGGYGCDYAVVQGEFVGVITENSIARKFLHVYTSYIRDYNKQTLHSKGDEWFVFGIYLGLRQQNVQNIIYKMAKTVRFLKLTLYIIEFAVYNKTNFYLEDKP